MDSHLYLRFSLEVKAGDCTLRQEDGKKLIFHIMRISGENGQAPKQVQS